jgi:hypothetical protein
MNRLDEIFVKYNFQNRKEYPLNIIEDIEKKIGFELPHDYKYYICNYNGFEGFIGEEFFKLWNIDFIIETNIAYQIIESLPSTFGIGSNGSSEFMAIEAVGQNNHHIVLSPFIDLDKQYNKEIGYSFTDTLIRLDCGKNWFE